MSRPVEGHDGPPIPYDAWHDGQDQWTVFWSTFWPILVLCALTLILVVMQAFKEAGLVWMADRAERYKAYR